MHPTLGSILLGIIAVIAGCLAASISATIARRRHQPLQWVCVAGAVVFVVGVVGQRPFPSPEEVARLHSFDAAACERTGVWDAGLMVPPISCERDAAGATVAVMPRISVAATPVAVGGMVIWLGGLALLLFHERPPERRPQRRPALSRLEEDDAV